MSANWQFGPKRNRGELCTSQIQRKWLIKKIAYFIQFKCICIFWTGVKYPRMHKLSVLILSLMSEWYHSTAFVKFTSKLLKKESYLRNINCANTLTAALCFPSVTCSICCLGGDVDVKSSHWWRRGDGKIISVAEEKFPLSEISDKHAGPQPQNNVDQST